MHKVSSASSRLRQALGLEVSPFERAGHGRAPIASSLGGVWGEARVESESKVGVCRVSRCRVGSLWAQEHCSPLHPALR